MQAESAAVPVIRGRHKHDHLWVHFIHHAVFAVLMTVLTVLLDEWRLIDWLDAAMLRVVGTAQIAAQVDVDPLRMYRPAIVDIDRDAYATVFGETSPLDRKRLGDVLGLLERSSAKVIVIDLDLAPTVAERASGGPRSLDTTLDSLARIKAVVLALPDPSVNDANLEWIRARCSVPGFHFATPDLPERMNAVTQIDTGAPTLATVSYALGRTSVEGREVAGRLCARVKRGVESEAELYRSASEAEHEGSRPLLPYATARLFLQQTTSEIELQGDRVALVPDLNASTVFVGGSYEVGDVFRAFGQNLSGLQVHAASFASLASGASDVPGIVAVLIDIVLGVLLGFIFHVVWEGFVGEDESVDQTGPGWLRKFVLHRAKILVAWTMPLLALALISWFAQKLLLHHYWLNPAPIVVGMFIHARTARHEASYASRHAAAQHHEGGIWATLKAHHRDTIYTRPAIAGLLLIARAGRAALTRNLPMSSRIAAVALLVAATGVARTSWAVDCVYRANVPGTTVTHDGSRFALKDEWVVTHRCEDVAVATGRVGVRRPQHSGGVVRTEIDQGRYPRVVQRRRG